MNSGFEELRGLDNQLIDARSGESLTWRELPVVDVEVPAAVFVRSSFDALQYVYNHARHLGELLLVASSRAEPSLKSELSGDGFYLLESGEVHAPTSSQLRSDSEDRLWLLTSGSTGRPKRIGHSLSSLTTVASSQSSRRWLCPYSPGTYAWWQLVTLSLSVPGQDLVVVDPADIAGWVSAAVDHSVTAVSATPTFWRQALMEHGNDLSRIPLQQATLGGEPVDQAVLDKLAESFPAARISWIYASSELGASIVVHDGLAGFPVSWLGIETEGRPVLSVVGEELMISSPHHGDGINGAVLTGDRVVIEDGRVHIVGRIDSDEINVGGSKVSAGVVRSILQSHPGVAWAAVRGRKAPLVGTMVVAEVVLERGAEHTDADLLQWCRERLPEYGVPRMLRMRDTIPVKETLKSDV